MSEMISKLINRAQRRADRISKIAMKRTQDCTSCRATGEGRSDSSRCSNCHGRGFYFVDPDETIEVELECPTCKQSFEATNAMSEEFVDSDCSPLGEVVHVAVDGISPYESCPNTCDLDYKDDQKPMHYLVDNNDKAFCAECSEPVKRKA